MYTYIYKPIHAPGINLIAPHWQVFLNLPDQPPRMLLGREAMLMQGFPISRVLELVNKTPEGTMMQLAGNMMATPVLLGLLLSCMESLPWQQSPGIFTRDDTDDAMEVFDFAFGLWPCEKQTKRPRL